MRDIYKEQAAEVARKHGLSHPLIDELRKQGFKVDQYQYIHPGGIGSSQGVRLINDQGEVVAERMAEHPGMAAILAMDDLLSKQNATTKEAT
jgi:hypothetical protein